MGHNMGKGSKRNLSSVFGQMTHPRKEHLESSDALACTILFKLYRTDVCVLGTNCEGGSLV